MSAATNTTVEVEDLKKVADQMSQTFMSVANKLLGNAQKFIEQFGTIMTKGFEDVRINNINCFTLLYLLKFVSIFELINFYRWTQKLIK